MPGMGPLFSIVISVYNDWIPLHQCLQSLARQTDSPDFEVIIVDDGSRTPAPEFIRNCMRCYPLMVVRHSHAGISAARNRGVQISKGCVLLFIDADCKLERNCLAVLKSTISGSPQHNCFQLHLVGAAFGLVGKAEALRLISLQDHLLQPDGCIRYLNTAGFAIRRQKVNPQVGVFDEALRRAEDTLLLANLMEQGELPLFVPYAIVQHAVQLSLVKCLSKDIRSAYLEGKTYEIIASKGLKIRMSNRERLSVLLSMWKTSKQPSIGRLGWCVLVLRQACQRITSFVYGCLHLRPNGQLPINSSKKCSAMSVTQ